MNCRTYLPTNAFALLVSIGVCTGAEREESTDWRGALEQKAAGIRATGEELRWLEIPWATSAEEAIELATAEKRPLLIFSVDGDPFDRC